MQAAKLVAVGWGLEKFLGHTVPTVFGEARDGAIITAGGMLFQSFVAPQLSGVLNSVMPKPANGNGNGNGVNGFYVIPGPGGSNPSLLAAQQGATGRRVVSTTGGINGAMTAPRY